MQAAAAELPATTDRAPVGAPHFPDALHAVVWRNWQLVEPQRLAAVLGASREQIVEVAASMGLPKSSSPPPEMLQRGYITLLRRNWHLLPYEQLLTLLDVSAEELAFRLREDDFLYIKLGSLKPRCEPVRYSPPDEKASRRAAEIKDLVRKHFGDALARPAEPRLEFIKAFQHGAPPAAADKPSSRQLRFIYSYFAVFGDPLSNPELDPYPDGLLAQLASQGVNGIWLHTVLRQLAPGGDDFPEFGAGADKRLANLRRLVERARRYGIDVYLYVNEPRAMPHEFFAQRPELAGVRMGDYTALCTSRPQVRKWLSDSLAHVFREVPHLGGVFTITASENPTNCASHGLQAQCPHCAGRSEGEIVAEVNAAIEEGVHRWAPQAKVIAYDWGWSGHGDATATIARLPKAMWLMSVSEWALPIERGGVKSTVGEYSISAVGPGPRATRHWQAARAQGLKTVAKVQLNNSWELSAVPYLPVVDLVAEHCRRLADAQVDGMMLSWSLGGYPSPNLQVAQLLAARPAPTPEEALQQVAERTFGAQAAGGVRRAWSRFSRAFSEYPYSGAVLYNAPQQMGPANLLYERPTGYAASMVGIPYDDLQAWRGPYPADVFAAQFQKVADGWAEGLAELKAAQRAVPDSQRAAAAADLRVAEAAQLHFASVANQCRFVLARDALLADNSPAKGGRQEISALLDDEAALARRMFDLASADSRLGYEASNHYFYVPLDLVEKVVNCQYLRERLAGGRGSAAIDR
jgi:hypothetical protein